MHFHDIPSFALYFGNVDVELTELTSRGLKTIAQLNQLILPDFKNRYRKVLKRSLEPRDVVTFTAILLDILIIHYGSSYFNKVTKKPYDIFLENYHARVFEEFDIHVQLQKVGNGLTKTWRISLIIKVQHCTN